MHKYLQLFRRAQLISFICCRLDGTSHKKTCSFSEVLPAIKPNCSVQKGADHSRMYWPSRLWLAAELEMEKPSKNVKGGQTRRPLKVAFLWGSLQNCRCLTDRLSYQVHVGRHQISLPSLLCPPGWNSQLRSKQSSSTFPTELCCKEKGFILHVHSALLTASKK